MHLGVFSQLTNVTIDWLDRRTEYIAKRGLAGVPSDADGNGSHPRLNDARISELKNNITEFESDNDAYYAKTIEH